MRQQKVWVAASLAIAATFVESFGLIGRAGLSAADPDPHAYFDALVARPDFWKGYSLRPREGEPVDSPYYAAQLDHPRNGGYANANSEELAVTYDPANDSDPHRQDAAKVIIPAFKAFTQTVAPISASTTGSEETILLDWDRGFDNGRGLRIGEEIVTVKRISGSKPSAKVTVIRGQHGTRASAHPAGAPVYASQNSLANQVRLPIGSDGDPTRDGNTYLFTWDGFWTSSYLNSGLTNHKTFQFTSDGDALWLEPQTRFDGGADGNAPGFNPATDIASMEVRVYQNPDGEADWRLTNGNVMGPGSFTNQPIRPFTGRFIIKANTWTRFWVQISQRANDYDVMDLWAADESRDPVHIYSSIPISIRPGSGSSANTIWNFWLEYNTSTSGFVRGDQREFVAYVRNFAAMRNPVNVPGLLQRPVAGLMPPAAEFPDPPSAPTGLRILINN